MPSMLLSIKRERPLPPCPVEAHVDTTVRASRGTFGSIAAGSDADTPCIADCRHQRKRQVGRDTSGLGARPVALTEPDLSGIAGTRRCSVRATFQTACLMPEWGPNGYWP